MGIREAWVCCMDTAIVVTHVFYYYISPHSLMCSQKSCINTWLGISCRSICYLCNSELHCTFRSIQDLGSHITSILSYLLWSSDSSERLKNVLSDKSSDLLRVVRLGVPNSQGNLNTWHRLGWMVVVPSSFMTLQRAAESLHLMLGMTRGISWSRGNLKTYKSVSLWSNNLTTEEKPLLWKVKESWPCSVPISQGCTNCFTLLKTTVRASFPYTVMQLLLSCFLKVKRI